MLRKNFAATGSFLAEDRPRALDLLGFSSQLVFNTFHNRRLHDWEHGGDLDLAYGAARAHNRGMVEFCAVDPRLLPTCYVPLRRLRPRRGDGRRGDRRWAPRRCSSPSGCPPGHSPSHRRPRSRCGRRAQEAGMPDRVPRRRHRRPDRPRTTSATACPIPPDFHGGEENFRSVDYMGIPGPPAQTLATMIFDGVFERFPRAAHRRDRAGRDLGAVVDAPDGVGVRGVRAARGAAAGAVAAAERVRAPPDARSRRTRPRTSAGSSSRPGPRCACSRPTTRTSRAGAARSSASRRRSATRPTRSASASTATTSSTSWVAAAAALAA